MKLNKTLTYLKNGGAIYGEKQLERVLNFKAVKSITREDPTVIIHLENGEDITTTYVWWSN